jgi:ATP-binding cassette subfamily B multidrug efflux pump
VQANNRRKRGATGPKNGGIGRAIRYLGRYRRNAILPYLFMIIATLAQLAVPRMVRNIIDAVTRGVLASAIVPKLDGMPASLLAAMLEKLDTTVDQLRYDAENGVRLLVTAVIAIVIFSVLRGVFAFLQVYWSERNSQAVAFDMRNDLFAKIQRLSFSYHDQNQTGQLMVRATDDVEKVRLFIGQGLVQLAGAFVLIVGTLIIIFSTNAQLALVALPILPVAFVLFVVFGAVSQPLFIKVQIKLSALNTILQENLAGIRVIKAFTREKDEQAKFSKSADAVMNQGITVARLFTFLFPLIFLIANLGQALMLYYGGRQIIGGTLTIGEWQEFSLYLIYLFLPIAQFGIIITQLGQASASASRVFEILDAKNDVVDKPGAVALPPVKGRVTFEDVTFRYFSSGEPVLNHVSFEAEPGQTIALLGATGSAPRSASCCRRRPCSPAPSATTSPLARLRRPLTKCRRRPRRRRRTISSWSSPRATTRRWESAAPRSPAARSSGLPSRARCCSTRAS